MDISNLSQLISPGSTGAPPSDEQLISILQSRHRAELHDIFIGQSILLHINPLKPTQDINDQSASLPGRTCSELTPHLYQLASNVFYSIRRTCKTQAIIYSGFSGSGKSTSLRLITNQFIKLSQNNSLGPSSQSSQALKLADQIPHLFLLLNSFTTAKTFQNPSASRLSTLLELHFDNLFHLAGAKLLVFGLERNRLRIPNLRTIEPSTSSTNCLLESLRQRQSLALHPDPSHYDLLSSSACYRIPDRPDADRLGFDDLRLPSNPLFEQSPRDFQDQSASVSNSETLELVSGLLGVPSPDLARVLTNRVQYIRKETVTVLLRPEAAVKQRDDFTNALYGVLVAYVVETAIINFSQAMVSSTNSSTGRL
ncbi:hypothetical protein KEM48_013613 [Puccinia striiformis f. sp. tritici PST-130]|nr:hypothetical protein KEM48_013613 [Puccinia striiformis f. sp. tritici PST-130]